MEILYATMTSFCAAGLTALIFRHFIKCNNNKFCIFVRSFLVVFIGVVFGSVVFKLVSI